MRSLASLLLAGLALTLMGCTKTDVTENDVKALGQQNSQGGYEEAMKKAGRGAELEAQKKMAAERQGDR